MKNAIRLSRGIDKVVAAVGRLASFLPLLIGIVVILEVFLRRFLKSPTLWSYETACFLFGIYIMLIIPYGIQLGVNVSVDVLYAKFSKRYKNIVNVITFLIFFTAFVIIFTQGGFKYAIRSFQTQERSWSTWAPLLWPVKMSIPVCGVLCCIQGISEFIKLLVRLFGKEELLKPDGKEGEA